MQFKWNKLSTNEKIMIGFVVVLLIAVLIRWRHIKEGIKKGFEPYRNEQPAK